MPKKMFLFAIPALLFFLTFWIVPIFQMFGYSVTNYDGFSPTYQFVGFQNYLKILQNDALLLSIKNTLIYTVVLVVVGNVLALAIAMALNTKIRGTGFYRTAMYIPTLFSAIVVGFIWSYVYEPKQGMIASLMNLVHLNGNSFNVLASFSGALYAIVFVDIWKGLGTSIVIYLAGLQTIDESLLEAGRVDGCNGWTLIRRIKLPLLSSAITINVILSVINGLKAFDYPFIMTNGGPGNSTNTLMYTIYQIAFNQQKFGRASAFGVVSFILIIAITAVMVLFMNKREVEL